MVCGSSAETTWWRSRASHGVVLATGGYDSSSKDRASFDAGHEVSTVSLPSVTGDHLRLAGRVGARVAAPFRLPHNFLEPAVAEIRIDDGVVVRNRSIVLAPMPHAIIVNRHGRRFHDETTAAARDAGMLAVDVNAPWGYANRPCWAIWDAQHVARYLTEEAMRTPGVVSAPTITELAAVAGIDPDGLDAEIAHFNANVAAGNDPDFGRGALRASQLHGDLERGSNPTLGTIEEAPFYAVRLIQRTMGIPHAGLVTDDHSRVLDWDDGPIEAASMAAAAAVAPPRDRAQLHPGQRQCAQCLTRVLRRGVTSARHRSTRSGPPRLLAYDGGAKDAPVNPRPRRAGTSRPAGVASTGVGRSR